MRPIPYSGGHAFVHPTALCPVACIHCMYSSTPEHTGRAWLTRSDIEALSNTLNIIEPAKITFSGGGEPFLKLKQCISLMQRSTCSRIEYVTAPNWASTRQRAVSLLLRIAEGVGSHQHASIRLSVDSFHWTAPRPVPFSNYLAVVDGFRRSEIRSRLELNFRGLLRERELVERRFIEEGGAAVEVLDEWNSILTFPDGLRTKLTYNVLRFSGAAATNGVARLSTDVGAIEYFQHYAGLPDLNVAHSLNDASDGAYEPAAGAAFTFDSDGSYFIFGASPPDWRGTLSAPFSDNLRLFNCDPLTYHSLEFGALRTANLMRSINAERVVRATSTEDIARLIPDLFTDEVETAVARLCALQQLADADLVSRTGLPTLALPAAPQLMLAAVRQLAAAA